MGNSTSTAHFPPSTSTLCVLPLRTNGQSRFSVAVGPMPASVSTRLTEAEYGALIESVNKALHPLSHFGLLSLLLPFILVDVLTMVLLCVIDPGLLLSPWEYPLAELALPIALEFGLIFCGFPAMVYLVNRRVDEVQARVRAELDAASRMYGGRGVNFQLKQGIFGNGAATNLWIELSVLPLLQVPVPVPVPVPVMHPILVPSAAPPQARDATPSAASAAAAASSPAAADPLGVKAEPSSRADAVKDEGGSREASSSAEARAAEPAGEDQVMQQMLMQQQVESLRVLQENQLLRQYLQQCQTLISLQNEQYVQLARAMQAQAASARAAATAPSMEPPSSSAGST